jgi:hypothetical protein
VKDITTALRFRIDVMLSVDRRTQNSGLIISHGKISDSAAGLLETILLQRH